MRLSVVLLLAGLVPAPAPAHPDSLSLGEAVAIGLAHSALVRASAAEADAAAARAAEAATALLPSLRLEAAYAHLSDVPPFEVRLPQLPSPVVVSPTVRNSTTIRLGLHQPLFAGFRLRSNARAANRLAAAAEADRGKERDQAVLTVITAYWTLFQTLRAKEAVDENAGRVERHLGDTKRLIAAGLAGRYLRQH